MRRGKDRILLEGRYSIHSGAYLFTRASLGFVSSRVRKRARREPPRDHPRDRNNRLVIRAWSTAGHVSPLCETSGLDSRVSRGETYLGSIHLHPHTYVFDQLGGFEEALGSNVLGQPFAPGYLPLVRLIVGQLTGLC